MLYDLGRVPPPKSLLESVFMLIANRRRHQELLKTRVLIDATLAPHVENGTKQLSESVDRYAKALMPYLDKVRAARSDEAKKALDQWTNRGPMVVRPLWMAKKGGGAWKSALKRGAERVREMEAARRQGRLVRIG